MLPNADGEILGIVEVAAGPMLDGDMDTALAAAGITTLRYVDTAGGCSATSLQQRYTGSERHGGPGNLFNDAADNGCGTGVTLGDNAWVAYWTDTAERVVGPGAHGQAAFDGRRMRGRAGTADATAPIYLTVGIGPSASLFDARQTGRIDAAPKYLHVAVDQYNRFIALFHVGEATTGDSGVTWSAPVTVEQVGFVGVVDAAGDTKDEELGAWGGPR